MDARSLGDAGAELASLRRLAVQRLAVALGAALVAGPVALLDASLAVAVGAGAVFEAILALASATRRRALIASLALHREAYLLPEVRRYGTALTTMESRRALARSIAASLRDASRRRAGPELIDRVTWQATSLAALAKALIEPANAVEPTAMAACLRLFTDGRMSPLLNPALPRGELDGMLRRIHASISPRPRADTPATSRDRSQAA